MLTMPEAQATARTEEETTRLCSAVVQTAQPFRDPKNFINRELSWLEFNRRVLEEAQDPTQPLIERVKFLAIVSSNLDEFFEIRVAGIKQQIESETSDVGPDGMSPTETFNGIQRRRANWWRRNTRSGTTKSRRPWPNNDSRPRHR